MKVTRNQVRLQLITHLFERLPGRSVGVHRRTGVGLKGVCLRTVEAQSADATIPERAMKWTGSSGELLLSLGSLVAWYARDPPHAGLAMT